MNANSTNSHTQTTKNYTSSTSSRERERFILWHSSQNFAQELREFTRSLTLPKFSNFSGTNCASSSNVVVIGGGSQQPSQTAAEAEAAVGTYEPGAETLHKYKSVTCHVCVRMWSQARTHADVARSAVPRS